LTNIQKGREKEEYAKGISERERDPQAERSLERRFAEGSFGAGTVKAGCK